MKKTLLTGFFTLALALSAASSVHAQSSSYTGNPVGNLDGLSCSGASGWSYDPDFYQPVVTGCTNSSAVNYDPNATVDDGSCVVTPLACVSRYRWVNITAGTVDQNQGCAAAGATAVASSDKGICASGEDRPTSGYDVNLINYSRGTWGGGNGGGGTTVPWQNGGYRCYQGGQKWDKDNTDVAVAYYCDFGSSFPDSCPADNPPPPTTRYTGGGGGGCFAPETTIVMADGSVKAVSALAIGDTVRGETSDNRVIEVKHVLLGDRPLYSINNRDAFVTAGHPFKTKAGWKSIDPSETKKEGVDLAVTQLVVGDYLVTRDGFEQVSSIVAHAVLSSTLLYNPVLDGDHTYYADGLLVHNKLSTHVYLNLAPEGFFNFISSLFKPLIAHADANGSNQVLIYEGTIDNGTFVATVNADQSRPDVNAVMGVSGNHGFSWAVPQSYSDGASHTFSFYGTNTDGAGKDSELGNSPMSIQCAPTVQSNSAPSSPSLSCPSNGSMTNTSLAVYFTSSDAEGNNVRYLIDWDANGTIDQVIPGGGAFAPSGSQQSSSRSWSSAGTKTVNVSAEDDQGSVSATASCSFSLIDSPAPTTAQCVDGSDNDGDGKVDFPADPGCANASDDSEDSDTPACTVNCGAPDPGNGGGNGAGNGNGGGPANPSGFTVSGADRAAIQFIADLPSTSETAPLSINPVGGFAQPVTLSIQSIRSAGGADLPSTITPTYYFGGQQSSTAVMTYNPSYGQYVNTSGTIGTTFAIRLSKKIPEKYYVTIVGQSGNVSATHVIEINPTALNPDFREI